MIEELKKVMDEILKECKVEPALLHPALQKLGYLTLNEVAIIESKVTPDGQILKIFQFLKEKDEAVFRILQQICQDLSYVFFNLIQTKLKEAKRFDLICEPSFPSNVDPNFAHKLKTVQRSLKEHYEQDLESIMNRWKKFDVVGNITMDNFRNQNIIVKEKDNKETTFKDFDQLFSADCRRFIIIADAGYGKSTFVHEMARQWVEGEHFWMWTKKFSLLFLIRLSEVPELKWESLEGLLTMCLSPDDAGEVIKLMGTKEFMKSCLFIFDGFDEFQDVKIAERTDDMIYGRGPKLAHVVITSRPCKKIKELEEKIECNNHYIELKGYTENSANIQLQKFGIDPKNIEDDFRDVFKVPLFNTLFCITHKKGTVGCWSICITIKKFVKFACKRQRKSDPDFSEIKQNEIIMMLGQAAQNKFSLMKGVYIEFPTDATQHLPAAINIGLVSEKSTAKDIIFKHKTIAEYCAAYYWDKKSPLKVKDIDNSRVLEERNRIQTGLNFFKNSFRKTRKDEQPLVNVFFAKPKGGSLLNFELFSCFLSHLSDEFKIFLWQNFDEFVPLLDKYDTLPKRKLEQTSKHTYRLSLLIVPLSDQNTVMDKIEISTEKTAEKDLLVLSYANFESGKKFENITKIKHLKLSYCSFKITPEEFFRSYNIKHLDIRSCTFNDCNSVEVCKNGLVLEYLNIDYCNCNCKFASAKLLPFIMKHCTTLKGFKLIKRENMKETENASNFISFGEGWISYLKNNKMLLHSIEIFILDSAVPVDLKILFETLGKMVNLKNIEITVSGRKLTKEELNLLKSSSRSLKKLEILNIKVKDEDGKELNINNFNNFLKSLPL